MPDRNTNPPLRPRPFKLDLNSYDSNTSNTRNGLLTPTKGFRTRVVRIRVIQEQADGRHLMEVYFGTAADIQDAGSKAVAIMDVPNNGSDDTRTFEAGEGPRGLRDEVLSFRWLGTPPTTVHKINVETTEAP